MLDAWTPRLLRRAAPDARLLVLVRDPVERFRSGRTLAENRLTVGSTARAAANAAFGRGLYADQLLRLWRVFPREQVLVLQYERCVADARSELRRTFTVWLLRVIHRSFPGVTIHGVADLEDLPMIEENMKAWRRRMQAEARQEGRREGKDEGRIEGMREVLLGLMKQRFGRVPLKIRAQIKALDSQEELRRLSAKLLSAGSFEEMGFH